MKNFAALLLGLGLTTGWVMPPHYSPRRSSRLKSASFDIAKNGLIGVWLFGGLVPALVGINVYAAQKLTTPRADFVKTTANDALPLASLGAPDVVSRSDVVKILTKLEKKRPGFEPLAQALGGTGTSGPLYLRKAAFQSFCKDLKVGDAAIEGIFDAWARGSGVASQQIVDDCLTSWTNDMGAVERSILSGRATIFAGFLGLATLDVLVFGALAYVLQESGLLDF